MDLYEIESKTMFAVKIGKSSGDLCYAIDQSITALKNINIKKLRICLRFHVLVYGLY